MDNDFNDFNYDDLRHDLSYDDMMILSHVPEAEYLSYGESLELANQRDEEQADLFLESYLREL